jgi:hypothetical protein
MAKPLRFGRKQKARDLLAKKIMLEIPRIERQNAKIYRGLPARIRGFGRLIKQAGFGKIEVDDKGNLSIAKITAANVEIPAEKRELIRNEATGILIALKVLRQNHVDFARHFKKVEKYTVQEASRQDKKEASDLIIESRRQAAHLDAAISKFQALLDHVKKSG